MLVKCSACQKCLCICAGVLHGIPLCTYFILREGSHQFWHCSKKKKKCIVSYSFSVRTLRSCCGGFLPQQASKIPDAFCQDWSCHWLNFLIAAVCVMLWLPATLPSDLTPMQTQRTISYVNSVKKVLASVNFKIKTWGKNKIKRFKTDLMLQV